MSSTRTVKPGLTRSGVQTSSTSRAKGASRQGVRTLVHLRRNKGRTITLDQLSEMVMRAVEKSAKTIPRKWLDPQEAALYLGIAQSTLYAWKSQKKIKAATVGGVVRFLTSDLDAFLEKHT